MSDDLYVSESLTIPKSELIYSVSLSSGAGGQHVNKTNSRVTLRWNMYKSKVLSEDHRDWLTSQISGNLTNSGDLVFSSDEHRSQHQNWNRVREKMAQFLKKALHKPKKRKKTRPTKSSQRKRVEHKKNRGALKASRQKPKLD
ncbi:MAG: aminoacyl-tRNA hydrolase [Proteobacteria bacterium]|nr:aminoacyl-tRNA hydrolase [Pseudomonadota bacterium]